ncbi:MAG: 5-(carboxyamino)imidazole ribonucleotide synthase [Thermoleophilaceae bacterium]|nr:5-(carboxyamino)imidazole ribonucleotide synthase [Thermoleophilaceae bacterium]
MAARLGIVGGGQLGRMLALAAAPLGVECHFVDPSPDAGARVAADQIVADYENIDALIELSARSDVVTFEFENVSAPALAAIAGHTLVAPAPRSLQVSQDRLLEKQLFESLGFPTAPYRAVETLDQLESAVEELGAPSILKTRRLGYDGKGQVRIGTAAGADHAWKSVEAEPSVLEAVVDFKRELSVVIVRAADGSTVAYPLAENHHRSGVLHTSRAPVMAMDDPIQILAVERATAIATELAHVGALALELFEVDGELLLNELAPRVHNSGHWTIDGCGTSQFENHVRAVTGLPLGVAEPIVATVMVNFVGGLPAADAVLHVPGAKLHLYDKSPRIGRKLGHANVVDLEDAADSLEDRAAVVTALADGAWK